MTPLDATVASRSAPGGEQVAALLAAAAERYHAGRPAEAESLARQALALEPANPLGWNLLGVFLRTQDRPHEAIGCYRRGLDLVPDEPALWSNLGNAYKDVKEIASALYCHRRATTLAPRTASWHFNHGIALTAAGRLREAIAAFDRSLAHEPGDAQTLWDRGRAYLALGDFARGWQGYEARSRLFGMNDPPGQPWDGGDYRRRRLLILSEQGFGDMIWAARYLGLAKERGGELILQCQPELAPLFAAMGVVDRIVATGETLPPAELHLRACSLAGLFTQSFAEIPPAPYLAAPPERRAKFAAAMACAGRRLRVGIVWSGSVTFVSNSERAAPLASFLHAFALPGVQLYSLQKGPPAAELRALPPGAPIIDLAPLLDDFADTAAAVELLDLVIMTDSAVAHLGGSLARPVWLLLSFVPYWLWLSDRGDSPWYPSLRLFRPAAWGDWTGVFDAAAAALLQRAAEGSPSG